MQICYVTVLKSETCFNFAIAGKRGMKSNDCYGTVWIFTYCADFQLHDDYSTDVKICVLGNPRSPYPGICVYVLFVCHSVSLRM